MIRPLRDRIVVRPLEQPESSILQVVRFTEKHYRGEVIAIGPVVKFDEHTRPRAPTDAQVGDIIRFTDIFKFPVVLDHGEKRLILQEADIFGIEEREDMSEITPVPEVQPEPVVEPVPTPEALPVEEAA